MANKLRTLQEHDAARMALHNERTSNTPRPNGIACPTCGAELLDSRPNVSLQSYPAKKNVHCLMCGYTGYRIA